MGVEENVLICPSCQMKHRIRPEMAGRRAKCKCGNILEIPAAAPVSAPAPQDEYDIIETAPPRVARQSAYAHQLPPEPEIVSAPIDQGDDESDEQISKAAADAALARGYMPKHKRVETEDENPAPKPNIFLDVILPVALIPAGVILCFVQAMYFDKGSPKPFSMIAVPTIVSMVASLALMIGAVIGTAASLGMVFHGSIGQTILKICGIALIPAAVGAMVDHSVGDINGNILSVFSAIGLYLLLTKIILRQPWQDTGIIVFALWVIRALVMYAMYKVQGAQSGSAI